MDALEEAKGILTRDAEMQAADGGVYDVEKRGRAYVVTA